MKYTAELKTNIKISSGRSVSASVVAELEEKNDTQISIMRDTLEEMVKGYSIEAVEVKTAIKQQPAAKMVSGKQVGLIRFLLKSAKMPERDLCRKYSVSKLDELTMADARDAIQDLKTRNLFD